LELILLKRFSQLRNQVNAFFTSALKKMKIGPGEARLILYLKKNKSVLLKEAAQKTITDPAAITRAVENLINKNLVIRESDTKDKRCKIIQLNSRGKEVAKEIAKIQKKSAQCLFGVLTQKEKMYFLTIMKKLIENLENNHHQGNF
jgi:DNA-binding MarR family transcriptional regulator